MGRGTPAGEAAFLLRSLLTLQPMHSPIQPLNGHRHAAPHSVLVSGAVQRAICELVERQQRHAGGLPLGSDTGAGRNRAATERATPRQGARRKYVSYLLLIVFVFVDRLNSLTHSLTRSLSSLSLFLLLCRFT